VTTTVRITAEQLRDTDGWWIADAERAALKRRPPALTRDARFAPGPTAFVEAIAAEAEQQLAAWRALPPEQRRSDAGQDGYIDGLFAAISVIEELTGRDLLLVADRAPEVSGQTVSDGPVSAPGRQTDDDRSHPVPPARSADRAS